MSAQCPACEADIPSDAAYCPACGTAVDGAGFDPSDSNRTLAAITHVLALVTWIIGPLVVLIISDDAFVIQNAKNALVWQLLLVLYGMISLILIIVVVGIFLLVILALLDLIFCIVAAIKASEGEAWQYPLTPAV